MTDPATDPTTDLAERLPDELRVTIHVPAVRHAHGLVWPWTAAIAEARDRCSECRPMLPCWRHVTPMLDLADLHNPFGTPAGEGCAGCGAPAPVVGTVVTDQGSMLACACDQCVWRLVGPERTDP